MKTKLWIWPTLALVEFGVILFLYFLKVEPQMRSVQVSAGSNRIAVPFNPLHEAIQFDSSDARFEQLVQKYPEYISRRPPGRDRASILSASAILLKTNYVRSLILHGADVADAIRWNQEYGSERAVNLLRQVQEEVVSAKNAR